MDVLDDFVDAPEVVDASEMLPPLLNNTAVGAATSVNVETRLTRLDTVAPSTHEADPCPKAHDTNPPSGMAAVGAIGITASVGPSTRVTAGM